MFRRCFVEKSWKIIRSNLDGLVLDIGTFDGLLVSPHKEAIGIDIVPNRSYVPIVAGDMHRLPFKREVFNTVAMCHVLEHTDKPIILLKEVKRVLKIGGKLIIAIPNAMAPMARILRFLLGYDGYGFPKQPENTYWCHKIFLGFEDLRYLIEKTGLILYRSFGSTPHLPMVERIFDLGFLRSLYWKLGDLDKKNAKDLIFISKKRAHNLC